MSDIYERLIEDHEKQRHLLMEINHSDAGSEERKEMWMKLRAEAIAHAAAEEQIFYAEMMENPDGTDEARHSVAEHKEMDDIIEELDAMGFDAPGWLNKFRTLKEMLEHHTHEEEDEIFVTAKKVISKTRAKELAAEFNKRKEAELKEAEKETKKAVAA